MPGLAFEDAIATSATGDLWLFRGRSLADRAIQTVTNSPVNHVGMAIALDDLPPLLWHAELGRALPDAWSGRHHRGVQLHDLRGAVLQWGRRYGQRGWLRQLSGPAEVGKERPSKRSITCMSRSSCSRVSVPSSWRSQARWP